MIGPHGELTYLSTGELPPLDRVQALVDDGAPARAASSPSRPARAAWLPSLPLDQAGNSIKGQLVARFLSSRLGVDLFASERLVS